MLRDPWTLKQDKQKINGFLDYINFSFHIIVHAILIECFWISDDERSNIEQISSSFREDLPRVEP